ncbi:MAG: membrane protein insertion efficiency factor YidD [Candidatus Sumerlaeaceae bacterium]
MAGIRGYQRWISRWFPPVCRFHPSCSSYALEALQTKPFIRALVMIAWRIVRCNPLSPGGYDPVNPDPPQSTTATLSHEAEGK